MVGIGGIGGQWHEPGDASSVHCTVIASRLVSELLENGNEKRALSAISYLDDLIRVQLHT